MSLKSIALSLALAACTAAPGFANALHPDPHPALHATAVPVYCADSDDFFTDGISRFVNGVYQGALFEDVEGSVGFRIDIPGSGAQTASWRSKQSTNSVTVAFYEYAIGNGQSLPQFGGLSATQVGDPYTLDYKFVKPGNLANVVNHIWFYAFPTDLNGITVKATNGKVNGIGIVPIPHGEELDCTTPAVEPR